MTKLQRERVLMNANGGSVTHQCLWIVGALLALANNPTAAATAKSGSMEVLPHFDIGDIRTSSADSDSWSTNPRNLSVSALVEGDYPGGGHVSVYGSGVSSWQSSVSGSVNFSKFGWKASVQSNDQGLALRIPGNNWQYSFLAGTNDSLLSMSYNVIASAGNGPLGNLFGLSGWSFEVSGGPQGSQYFHTGPSDFKFDPTGSGTFFAALTPGNIYVARLYSYPNRAGYAPVNVDVSMDGRFEWTISAVPEPSSLATLLIGVAVVLTTIGNARRKIRVPGLM